MSCRGAVAERLGRGLQSLVQRFESARRLSPFEAGLRTAFPDLPAAASRARACRARRPAWQRKSSRKSPLPTACVGRSTKSGQRCSSTIVVFAGLSGQTTTDTSTRWCRRHCRGAVARVNVTGARPEYDVITSNHGFPLIRRHATRPEAKNRPGGDKDTATAGKAAGVMSTETGTPASFRVSVARFTVRHPAFPPKS